VEEFVSRGSVSSSLSLFSRTVFGQPTASKSVGGLIAMCVNFAKGIPKLCRILSSNAATPCWFGTLLSLGLASPMWTLRLGAIARQSKSGGLVSSTQTSPRESPLHP
jgi:hypothetical protein